MKRNGLNRLVTCAIVVLAAASTATAQTQKNSNQKISDTRISELIREAALRAGVEPATMSRAPSAQAVPGQPGASVPVVRLSLDDAIKLALDRNLDISVQRLNRQTFDFSLS